MTEMKFYEFRTDGGEENDVEAGSLLEAAVIASRRIKIAEWNDGAWGVVSDPDTEEELDVPSRSTN